MANIGGNLYTRQANNLNHIHRDSQDLLPVITILGTDVNGGETFLYDGDNMNDIGKRAHVLKLSHGRCVLRSHDKCYMKDIFGLVIELFYCLSSPNIYFSLCA